MEFNEIYNIDCLEGMAKIPNSAVDFVLTDLPFGMTDCHWDKKIDLVKFWGQIHRVTKKNAAVALFANGKFLIELAASNLKEYRYKWIWLKCSRGNFLNSKKMPLTMHEDILIFYQALPTYNPQFFKGKTYTERRRSKSKIWANYDPVTTVSDGKRYPVDVLQIDVDNNATASRVHPTQKPIELLEYFIKTYTNEGELVLDATTGSGSTAVAAINTNRQFIGFETDEKYFEIAQKRIAEALQKKSESLF